MESNEERKQRRRAMRSKAKAQAYTLLSALGGELPTKPVAVTCTDGAVRVSVAIARVGDEVAGVDAAGPPVGIAGVFLSPLEAAVVNALRAAGDVPLSGKVIAGRVSQKYGTRIKYLLQNLEERRVIRLEYNVGYSLLPTGAESRA